MRIAVTGAPGVGKTSLCDAAIRAGWLVESLLDLAEERGLAGSTDSEDGARPIDVDALAEVLSEDWTRGVLGENPPTLIDGHMAHLLPTDAICVLRCDPLVLSRRLSERGYPDWKVEANVEWELMGGAWSDGIGGGYDSRPVLEIDATSATIEACFNHLSAWVNSGTPAMVSSDAIDWIARQSE